jgi:beta-lactamase superfamily II metal-dependent hydrolase
MAHKATFYPEGNADTCLIEPEGGGLLLFDFADNHVEGGLEVNLSAELREKLEEFGRDEFDIVAFTHLDDDHIHGATEFFHLRHSRTYQGEGRAKINQLWVPAGAITESNLDGEALTIRAEARYRLIEGEGVRVFSRPKALEAWLASKGIRLEDRAHLITDAGSRVPGLDKWVHGVEFFVHSPFALQQDGDERVDRNRDSLVLQANFRYGLQDVRLFLSADSTHEALANIVRLSEFHENGERLEWDIMKIPHHCSSYSLAEEKGVEVTEPEEDVARLFEEYGQTGGILVSPSKPIPYHGDNDQPPHRQAANYYKGVARQLRGEFQVTMEHPRLSKPEPLVIVIDDTGARVRKIASVGTLGITNRPAPRAG